MKTWRERIAEARVAGQFSRDDFEAARSWSTCAVGEQRHLYPDAIVYNANYANRTSPDGQPIDRALLRLGCGDSGGFFDAVREGDISRAERLLDRIEDRALELKRQAI